MKSKELFRRTSLSDVNAFKRVYNYAKKISVNIKILDVSNIKLIEKLTFNTN